MNTSDEDEHWVDDDHKTNYKEDDRDEFMTSYLADILSDIRQNSHGKIDGIKIALFCLISIITDNISVTKLIKAAIQKKIKLFPTEQLKTDINIRRIIYNIKNLDDAKNIVKILFITLHVDNYDRLLYKGKLYDGDMSKMKWMNRSAILGMVYNAITDMQRH